MAGAKSFEDLIAWQKSRELVALVYAQTRKQPLAREYGFCDQLQRAATSVMSNIAEGFGRGTNRDFIRFLDISRASVAEVQSLLYVATDNGHVNDDEYQRLKSKANESAALIAGLSRYLKSKEKSKS